MRIVRRARFELGDDGGCEAVLEDGMRLLRLLLGGWNVRDHGGSGGGDGGMMLLWDGDRLAGGCRLVCMVYAPVVLAACL